MGVPIIRILFGVYIGVPRFGKLPYIGVIKGYTGVIYGYIGIFRAIQGLGFKRPEPRGYIGGCKGTM